MADLITALGLVLVIEGAFYALFPEAMKRLVVAVLQMPVATLRWGGAVAFALGVAIVWLQRG